ncbi:PilZ domain-containing protein [Desulfonatronum thioautotrophicum]|uniref:PilZ domain-containing protein n=1 Tax=Desulfonatronum thioautotrophicum TaxID=617001 RepID=UPI0005EBC973|nr:PilZ domain-containing protein [Desulfonatronum thioautotrophicum]
MLNGDADRRKDKRREVLAPAVLGLTVDGKRYETQAIVKNISMGGLQVALYEYDEDLKHLDLMHAQGEISFRFSNDPNEYKASCKALRVERQTYTIQLGAMFTAMNEDHRQHLQIYCAAA